MINLSPHKSGYRRGKLIMSGYKTDNLKLPTPSFGPETGQFWSVPSKGLVRPFYGGRLEGSFLIMTKNKPKMVIK